MSKTNWQDPGSSEILSSHISGLQEAVGKIEDAIGLQTAAETDVPLTEVYISDTDRYRIYQAPVGKRNWVDSPAPVIKKNGVPLTLGDGFTIDYGGGAIILSPAATGSDVFTADVTRVNNTHSITPASIGAASASDLTELGNIVTSHLADFVSVKRYGAIGDDITDDTTAIQNTLNNHKYVKIPEGVYKITSKLVTYPGQIIIGDGIGVSILKKYFNGALINLEKYCGLQNIEIDGNGSLYTGSGIEITAGDNTTIIENQGHQRIDMCQIHDTESWCVEYPNANKGWLSKITRSLLYKPLNKPACVKWPDEPANGGSRDIIDCYSNCPIVDVSGCDNGMINHNTIGGDGTSNQGILFSDSINGAKKIIITNNRIAIADGSINIKGNNHIINNNIIAGSVVFEPGAIGCKYGIDNIITGSVTDNSGQMNDIYAQKQGFTPVWTSSGTQPSFGNADVRGEYTRIGQRVKFAVYISFGSTTTFGTGTWFFSLPVPKISGITTRFVGSAFLGNQAGVCYIDMNNQKITLYCSTPGTVTYNTPITWASGNQLIFEGEYTL